MRILELAFEYPPHVIGGLGSHLAALAPALARAGAEVHVVVPRFALPAQERLFAESGEQLSDTAESLQNPAGLFVHRVEPPPWAHDLMADVQRTNEYLEVASVELIRQVGPVDIIHAHDWLVAQSAIALKHRYKVPLLATFHATERGRGRGNLAGATPRAIAHIEWQLTYEAWRVITVSRHMASELQEYFSLPRDKLDIIPNGIDKRLFDGLEPTDLTAFREQYAQAHEAIVFNVGRLVPEKGGHLLVDAAAHVVAERPATRFVVAGSGGLLDTLRARAAGLGLASRVTFAGFVSNRDRNALYKVADCAVFPSLYEPFGIVALEAMAAACPVVAANTGGLAEVVQHLDTGWLVRPDSVEALADGILQTLKDPDSARARAKTAYEMISWQYDWEHIAAQTLSVMERMVVERTRVVW
ncbi:MAG: glycosyltransferase family 4 protein [Chloroflexi bacterium]|nr:glycosyltransferase family 4 protein [Chloroflexota bacterium]